MLWEHNATVLFLTQKFTNSLVPGVVLSFWIHIMTLLLGVFFLSCCVFVCCRFSVIFCLQGVSFGEAAFTGWHRECTSCTGSFCTGSWLYAIPDYITGWFSIPCSMQRIRTVHWCVAVSFARILEVCLRSKHDTYFHFNTSKHDSHLIHRGT